MFKLDLSKLFGIKKETDEGFRNLLSVERTQVTVTVGNGQTKSLPLQANNICPRCGKHKMKKHQSCYDCWYQEHKARKKSANGKIDWRYCQNGTCKDRFKEFDVKQMLEHRDYLFCSQYCIDEFEKRCRDLLSEIDQFEETKIYNEWISLNSI